jgi:midasin
MAALLAEWEAARDAADAAAEAEGVLFKQAKSRLAAGAAEEDDDADEAAFRAAHPNHAAAWADLAETEGMEAEEEGGVAAAAAAAPPSTTTPADPDSGTAGLSLTGPALAAIVADHAALYLGGGGAADRRPQNDTARFAVAFDTSAGLVAEADGPALSPALDDDDRLAAGRLLRLVLEHGAGTLTTSVAPATPASKGSGKKGGGAAPATCARPPLPTITDMEAPAPSESALLLPAATALRARLGDLLAEWPDNPVLTRIDAVAARLLDLPATAPLRAAAVGLDLLLSSAQLWQETAASHVRMDAALAPLSSLATRWRGAELAGWRATLERVEADVAAGATFFF